MAVTRQWMTCLVFESTKQYHVKKISYTRSIMNVVENLLLNLLCRSIRAHTVLS